MPADLAHKKHVELVATSNIAATNLDHFIAGSWRRCLAKHHLNPDTPPSTQVLESHHLKEHRQRHDYLIGVAQQELVDLYNQMQGSGYSIFLTDADGIILQQVCDPNYLQNMRKAGLRVGANWSEQANGTNGVGTCIVEQRPLTVHLEDHFHTKHTLLSCSAAPIRDPEGELLAVLDSSAARNANPRSDKQTLGLVRNTASFIEGLYFLRLHRSDIIIHLGASPDVVPQPRNPMIAITADGRITGANERALLVLGTSNRQALFGREVKHVFDLRNCPINSANAGQIQQLRLIDRGKYIYATWQAPAPQSTNSTASHTQAKPTTLELSVQPIKQEFGHTALHSEIETAIDLLDQNIALLLQGETGTGKDTIAKDLHYASRCSDGAFVAIDCCSATPEKLLALSAEHTPLEQAAGNCPVGGTLFLNNADLLCEQSQSKLVELLQQYERQTETSTLSFNLITACRSDLHALVEKQLFREDLFYRLAQYALDIPPLRERAQLNTLIDRIFESENDRQQKSLSLSLEAKESLMAYHWPGNIRELQSTLRAAVTICRMTEIDASSLPPTVRNPVRVTANISPTTTSPVDSQWSDIEAAEYEVLLRELRSSRWNISATAKKVNMSRNTIYRKMEKYGLSPGADNA